MPSSPGRNCGEVFTAEHAEWRAGARTCRPMVSGVSAVSSCVANDHQTMHHVSCPPSEIPYVGFSPVRLQTGIQPRPSVGSRRLKRKARIRTQLPALYVAKAPDSEARHTIRSGAFAQSDLTSSFRSNPVQRPLALQRVMLSRQVIAYYGLIRHSRPLPPAYFLRPGGSLPDGLVWAGTERLPNLLRMSLSSVPPSVPRRTERLLVAVASPLVLVLRLLRKGSTSAVPTLVGSRVG